MRNVESLDPDVPDGENGNRAADDTIGARYSPLGAAPEATAASDTPSVDFSRTVNGRKRAANTLCAYESGWRQFSTWCANEGLSALPATPETVAHFLVEQSQDRADGGRGSSVATGRQRISAIKAAHRISGLLNPTNAAVVEAACQQIDAMTHRRLKRVTTPLLARDVGRMVDAMCADGSGSALRDTAILLIGFAAALNREEICNVDVKDLRKREGGMVIAVRRPDSLDPFQVGVPKLQGSRYCPVSALERWLSYESIRSGAVFRRYYRGESLSEWRLSGGAIRLIVKRRASAVGFDPALVSAKSLRFGYIEEVRRSGADVARVAFAARHRNLASQPVCAEQASRFVDSPLHQALGNLDADALR